MTDVKPSGPLWVEPHGGELTAYDVWETQQAWRPDCVPARLIPGHGRVVPVGLVEAIRYAYEALLLHYGDQWLNVEKVADVSDALDAAIEGAL